jgi:hypothetical protein
LNIYAHDLKGLDTAKQKDLELFAELYKKVKPFCPLFTENIYKKILISKFKKEISIPT